MSKDVRVRVSPFAPQKKIGRNMEVSTETLEGLQRKMLVVIPSNRVEERVNEKLEEAAKTARINGFRPGKVPKREIKRRYGKSIREEVSSEKQRSMIKILRRWLRKSVNSECNTSWRKKSPKIRIKST